MNKYYSLTNRGLEILVDSLRDVDRDNISGVVITVDNTSYTYEAHSVAKVAEILQAQLDLLDDFQKEGRYLTLNSFEVACFV